MSYGKRRGALGFLVLQFWLLFRSVYVWKNLGFSVLVFIAVYGFIGFWFSWKILTGFRFWYPIWFLVFPIWPTLFGFWFLLNLSSNYTPPLILLDANVIERNAWQTNWNIAGILRGFVHLEWHPRLWSCIYRVSRILNDSQAFDLVEHLGQGWSICEPCLPTCQTHW